MIKQSIILTKPEIIKHNHFSVKREGIFAENGEGMEIWGRMWNYSSEVLICLNSIYDHAYADGYLKGFNAGVEAREKLNENN